MQAEEITSTSREHHHLSSIENDSIVTFRSAVKDIAFGSLAGMIAEIFEYPFDLAKVRLQAQLLLPTGSASSNALRFKGPMDCLMQTWKEEGVRGMYRGLPAPIVGSMAETAALFVTYTTFQNAIRSFMPSSSPTPEPLTLPQLVLAAGGAGFVTSFVLTPIELIKCKMQVQMMNFHPSSESSTTPVTGRILRRSNPTVTTLSSAPHIHTSSSPSPSSSLSSNAPRTVHDVAYRSPSIPGATATITAIGKLHPPGSIGLLRSIIDTHGIRGLWLGHTGTLLRETGSTAAWFVTKEWVARKLVDRRIRQDQSMYMTSLDDSSVASSRANTELLVWESAVSGAVAGAMGALLFYPADTVKSAIQTEDELNSKSMRTSRKPSTFLGVLRRMVKTHGVRGLYSGCGMTVARAVPSSGIIFVVYDALTAYFG